MTVNGEICSDVWLTQERAANERNQECDESITGSDESSFQDSNLWCVCSFVRSFFRKFASGTN